MQVLTIKDLNAAASKYALKMMRAHQPNNALDTPEIYREVLSIVGGRLAFLNKISRASSMVDEAKWMLNDEREWILSQIGLIKDCDDECVAYHFVLLPEAS